MKYALILICCLVALPATAQQWPDLVGVWKGTSRSVVAGDGGHFAGTGNANANFVNAELTVEWTEQDDGRLIGSITSANSREDKLGILSSDGVSLYTVDTNGQSSGRLIDADHFELCYMQPMVSDGQMVVSCVNFERQK